MRTRIDVARQRVGVSRFQLRDLPPIENARCEFVALLGQLFEHARGRRPRAGLRLAAARQLHLAKENIAELLRRSQIERLAGKDVNLGFEPRHLLRELAGEPRQDGTIDGDAAPLHARQRLDHGPLERVVDMRHALGGKPRFQDAPEPQRHGGIFGGIFRRLLDRHAGKADEGAARAGDLADLDRPVMQIFRCELVEAVAVAAGIEHVGHEHRVVDRRELEPAFGEHEAIDFRIVHDLEHARRFEEWCEAREYVAFAQLPRHQVAAEEIARAFAAMGERRVPRAPGEGASESPMRSLCIGSIDVVSVSSATMPLSCAAAITWSSVARSLIVRYAEPSIFSTIAASARAAASACGPPSSGTSAGLSAARARGLAKVGLAGPVAPKVAGSTCTPLRPRQAAGPTSAGSGSIAFASTE